MAKKNNFKTKVFNFLDRRKHSITENLRLVALIPLILIIIGLFQPLVGVSTGFYVSDSRGETVTTTPIWKPTENLTEISIGDFVFHKSLREFKIFGLKIGDMQFMGANLYDLVMTPLPSFEGISEVSSFLDSGALAFLTDENFINFCHNNLGDFGVWLVEFGKVFSEVANQASEIIRNVSNALTEINNVSTQIRSTIAQTESYLNIIDWIFIILSVFLFVVITLFVFNKGPKLLPKITFSIFTILMIVMGIAIIVCNSAIANALGSGMQDLSTSLTSLLNNLAPGVLDFLNNIFSVDKIGFVVEFIIFCGAGWWLTITSLVILTILSYLVPSLEKKQFNLKKESKENKQETE